MFFFGGKAKVIAPDFSKMLLSLFRKRMDKFPSGEVNFMRESRFAKVLSVICVLYEQHKRFAKGARRTRGF
jgi:hypothetical protein